MSDEEIKAAAIEFARRNRKRIAEEITDSEKIPPNVVPVSIFMAGSPGAGKTEFSKSFIDLAEAGGRLPLLRIDADELRQLLPGYTGNNSHLFQQSISRLIEEIHNFVLRQKQSFILDGTLGNYDKAVVNITRSLKRERSVFIFYVYQRPEVAWKFTQAREAVEGRNIPKSAFIEKFLAARENVQKLTKEFGGRIRIMLITKNFETNIVESFVNIHPGDQRIDSYLPEIDRKSTRLNSSHRL